jgi:hypothetical protein
MPTCESCNKTVENGQRIIHWICEDCKVDQEQVEKGE